MIIQNKYADYSANNIGVLDLPVELSPLAVSIVEQYTSVSLTNTKKAAINNFLQTLQTEGIYSKINMLLIPLFASSVNEAYLDVINQDATMVKMSSSVDNYETSNITLGTYGIRQTSQPTDNNMAPGKNHKTFTTSMSKFSIVHIKESGSFCLGNVGPSNLVTEWFCNSGSASLRAGNSTNGIDITHTWTVGNDYSEVITYTIGSDLSSSNFFDFINGVKQDITVHGTKSVSADINAHKICPFFPTASSSNKWNKNEVAVWGTASGLTESESQKLSNALKAFIAAYFA